MTDNEHKAPAAGLTDEQIDVECLNSCTGSQVIDGTMAYVFKRDAWQRFARAIESAVLASLAPAGLEGLLRWSRDPEDDMLKAYPDGQFYFVADVERWAASHAGVAAVPEGWKLVPVEPTQEMFAAARTSASGSIVEKLKMAGYWRNMLAAAPTPPATPSTAAVRAEAEHYTHREVLALCDNIIHFNGPRARLMASYLRPKVETAMLTSSPSTPAQGDVERDAEGGGV